ncbi:ankyrin, partial [Lizonia empirigonia]
SVHHRDVMGRTALDWATARAQLSTMGILIRAGASVDSMDREGRTTVLHAVDSGSCDALRMLIGAKANVNPIMREGLFRSSPLVAAAFGGKLSMVELLLGAGADVHACNPEGRTAL